MELRIELKNRPENLVIFKDITLEAFKLLLENNPKMLLEEVEQLEKMLQKPKGSGNNEIQTNPMVVCGVV